MDDKEYTPHDAGKMLDAIAAYLGLDVYRLEKALQDLTNEKYRRGD